MKKIFSAFSLLLLIGAQQIKAQGRITDTAESIQETRHHFQVNLPEQVSFKVSLIALDDWNDADFFNTVSHPIKKHIDYYTDSINNNSTLQNLLYIEKKQAGGFDKLVFRQVRPEQSEVVFKDGNYYNLKNSMDSLFYTYYAGNPQAGKRAKDALHQNQITITAKSLTAISNLSMAQVREVQQQLDSMVQATKHKVNNYRNPLYSSNSTWTLAPSGQQTSDFSVTKPFMGIVNKLTMGVGFGVIVFNNAISPTLELSLGYILKRSQQNALFVGVNYSLFTEIDFRNNNNLIGYLPLTLEFGTIRNHTGTMQRKTSIGYGVMIKSIRYDNSTTNLYLPGMQLNFGISNTISSSLMIATQLKRDAEHYVIGVSLKYNL